MRVKHIPKKLFTTACCIWDSNTDELIAGPDYKEFSPQNLELYGNLEVKYMECDIRENSDGELETYFDIYVERGDE